MGWDQNPSMLLVHVYCSELWASNFKKYFNAIHDDFIDPLYSIIFNQLAPRLSKEARETIKIIGDWYIQEYFSYIRDFGASSAPYLLPQYVLYSLVVRQISHHTIIKWITFFLSAHSKKTWSIFLIKVGIFTLLNVPHAKKQVVSLKELSLYIGTKQKHDLKWIIEDDFKVVRLSPSYRHDPNLQDLMYQGDITYE